MATTAKRKGAKYRRASSIWFPCGESIRYICLKCNGTLASLAQSSAECACSNVRIENGSVVVLDLGQFRAAVEVARNSLSLSLLPAWSTEAGAHDLWGGE